MEVNITTEEDKNIVAIIGRLDTTTAGELDKAISPLFGKDVKVVLECEKLEYISSSGLRIILMAYKMLVAKGGSLVLRHVGHDIMEVFKMTGFSSILRFED